MVAPRLGAMRAAVTRTLRAVRLVIRDGRIPRPLRWAGALGLLPVPGPFDEIVLLAVAGVLWLGYRDQLSEAWQKAAAVVAAGPAHGGGLEPRARCERPVRLQRTRLVAQTDHPIVIEMNPRGVTMGRLPARGG